ncbi:hypothetical protein ['Paenibacillus yunnanensis' Narsing Rao et al. 2020]|uniref:hypothetical protein n=1 Tax=Paenibacillus tengchongensis TaxID=2608684 RepID=UPI00165296C8|nr:hypothetical protein [Paenibacillus tengchongensis]
MGNVCRWAIALSLEMLRSKLRRMFQQEEMKVFVEAIRKAEALNVQSLSVPYVISHSFLTSSNQPDPHAA